MVTKMVVDAKIAPKFREGMKRLKEWYVLPRISLSLLSYEQREWKVVERQGCVIEAIDVAEKAEGIQTREKGRGGST